jgi:VIT1/CCC1 family predicted Fe2+/Mn2+ transporter
MTGGLEAAETARYLANRQKEIDGAALYGALAAATPDPDLAAVYRRLAAAEAAHAAFWEARLRAAGAAVPAPRPGRRTRVLAWLARRFGPELVLPAVVAAEGADSGRYAGQADARAAGLAAQEASHARVLRAVGGGPGGPGSGLAGPALAQLEGRHRAGGGNALRAAVLGANDGLVSNLSLVMGVAGAALGGPAILVTGLAGLLAGAGSMALGEWLSVQSARELYQRQIAIEAEEVAATPEEEQEELALIYQAKGLPEAQARAVAARLMADRGTVLDTLVREELGIDPESLGGSANVAAAASFALFAAGAVVPVLPFLFLGGWNAVAVSLALSALALFAVGAGITLMTGRSVLYSGARQVLFGLAAAALTFGIGRLIGVSLAG